MTSADHTTQSASLMDQIYRHQRHIYDASRKYYLLGRDQLIAGLNCQPGDRVLEIGCGTGRNLICAARAYPRTAFYGLDISREMLATAGQAIQKKGLGPRIRLAQGDACQFDAAMLFGVQRFDRVMLSYALSMIPDWPAVLANATALLTENGELHLVDFGQQEGLPQGFKRLLHSWLKKFHVAPREDLDAALRALAFTNGGQLEYSRPFRGYAQMAVFKPRAAPQGQLAA